MANTPGYILGLYKALIWRVGPYGVSLGDRKTIANGAVSPAIVINGPRTAGFAPKDPTELDITGSDKSLDSASFGNAKIGAFDLVVAEFSAALQALVSDSNVNSTLTSRWNQYGPNTNLSVPGTFGVMLISRYQPARVGINVGDRFHAYVFPRVQIRAKVTGPQYQAESVPSFRITPRTTDYTPLGLPFSDAGDGLDLGFEDDLGDMYEIDSPNPLHIASFKKDGTLTTFDLPYLPASSVITSGAAAVLATNFNNTDAPAVEVLSSASTTTGAVVISAAGTAGHQLTVMYETNYKATPA